MTNTVPPDHDFIDPLDRSLTMIAKWTNAVNLQAERLLSHAVHPSRIVEGSGEGRPFAHPSIDGDLYIISLRNLHLSLEHAQRTSTGFPLSVIAALRAAHDGFHPYVKQLKMARNAIEHFDEYTERKGGHKRKGKTPQQLSALVGAGYMYMDDPSDDPAHPVRSSISVTIIDHEVVNGKRKPVRHLAFWPHEIDEMLERCVTPLIKEIIDQRIPHHQAKQAAQTR